jgi:hypothetical protein
MAKETTVTGETVTAADAFLEHRQRVNAEAELAAYKWTLPEVEKLKAGLAGTGDAEADLVRYNKYQALTPYIEASRQRGEWKSKVDFTRAEAQAYIAEKGVTGDVWSVGEMNAIYRNPELYKEYGEELNRAKAEGRIFNPDPVATMTGADLHFAGEGTRKNTPESEAFTRELNGKLESIDVYLRAAELVAETTAGAETMDPKQVGKRTLLGYLERQHAKIVALDQPLYPVNTLDGFAGLESGMAILQNK